ncbi:hypothetical protein F5Y13DRAFT_197018 [Hypoxylon sp. FL1857]|nr:hypothetical protein F5Y13DRAFT_197018 [Hypoxylon sp. FL1857]
MPSDNRDRGRKKPEDSDDDDIDDLIPSENVEVKFRSCVQKYGEQAEYPKAPLYAVGEIVYLAVSAWTAGTQGSHERFRHQPRKIESFRKGYPRLSAFIDSERNFAIFRCFGRLHARLLLHKQDELVEIENRLEQIDLEEQTEYFLACRRQDPSDERRELFGKAEKKLAEYNELLACYYRNIERPRPDESNVKSVGNWLDGTKPLVEVESTFLNDWNDLRSPRNPADHGGMDVFLGNMAIRFAKFGFRNLFAPLNEHSLSDDEHILFCQRSQILVASRLLTTFFAVAFLTIPIVVLYNISTIAMRMVALVAFTAMFSSTLCWTTESRNYEILAVTAAYCAVMVVFVGNL